MNPNENGQEINQEEKLEAVMPTVEKPAEEVDGYERLARKVLEPVYETEGMSDRTREQFEKLKQHNAELAAELAASKQTIPTKSVLDELHPFVETPVSQAEDYQIDEDGTVDVAQLNRVLRETQQAAAQARQEALQAKARAERLTKEKQEETVHSKFPQLVPGSKEFDPDFFKRVKNELIGQMMEGKENYMEAAETVAKLFSKSNVDEVEKKVEEFKKTTEAKQNINAGTGSANNRTYSDDQELSKRTQMGDLEAFRERLKRAGL
jgi:hypothetical protein